MPNDYIDDSYPNHEPIFCAACGDRIGWYDPEFGDLGSYLCDDCAKEGC